MDQNPIIARLFLTKDCKEGLFLLGKGSTCLAGPPRLAIGETGKRVDFRNISGKEKVNKTTQP